MPTHERPMPEVEPLVYFGNWCGPGWSAGHRSRGPLTPRDKRTKAVQVFGATGRYRESPVDLACKAHDLDYDAADKANDPLRRALMIKAADERLLQRVSATFARYNSGRLDLNMGELLFLDNLEIAFRTKLIADGAHVVDLTLGRAEQGLFARHRLRHDRPLGAILWHTRRA